MTLQETALSLVETILSHGIRGFGPLASAVAVADSYRRDDLFGDDDARVTAMIRWEASKSAVVGFGSCVVGGPWAAAGIPAGVAASFVGQARLAAAIAHLRGYSLQDERVRTFILLCLLGDGAVDVLKGVGVQVANKLALSALKQLPGRSLLTLNKAVGFRLVTKFGTHGTVNLVKWIPVAGGVVGALVEGSATYSAGRAAAIIFTAHQ